MALTSEATTLWFGDLTSGSGTTSLDSSDAGEFPVTWQARSDGEPGRTNPEELLGAAHSACYSMAFSKARSRARSVCGAGFSTLKRTPPTSFDRRDGCSSRQAKQSLNHWTKRSA